VTDRPTLYLIDGYALIYRAFFAMISRPLRTSSGENTSAPFGLTRFLIQLLEERRPDHVAVVLDAGDSFRSELFPDYKATREKMPDELAASLPRCRDLVEAFGVPMIAVEGWEADDVIGTLAARAGSEGLQTIIVSGDKDFYQLIDEHTFLLNPGRGGRGAVEQEWVTPENASRRLGVRPDNVTDYLALIGDSSDNVPGVRGIGPKTAPGLIEAYGSLEEILARAGEVSSARVRRALMEGAAMARLSKTLVTIRRDAPVAFDRAELTTSTPDRGRLRDLFLSLEFHSLAREFAPDPVEADAGSEEGSKVEIITDVEALAATISELRAAPRLSLGVEISSEGPLRGRLVGLALAAEPGRTFYLPFGHQPPPSVRDAQGNPELALDVGPVPNLPRIASLELAELRALLADPDVPKLGHDVKRALLALDKAGAPLSIPEFDTSLASYCLDPGKRGHTLELLALERLNLDIGTYEDLCGKGKARGAFEEIPLEEAAAFSGQRAATVLRLAEPLYEELERHSMVPLFEEIEMPLVPVLARMERTGILLDLPFFSKLGARLESELAQVGAEISKLAGEPVNLRSVPQLRTLLFDKLGLPAIRRTKTGPSTDESVLTELAMQGHQVPRLILEYRELDKLNSTYVSKLPAMVDPATGRLHTSFNQTVAATGRLSSSDPNLQNIPIRSVLGREIRKAFVAAPGCRFLAADYSQVELRVLAHLSGDPAFVQAFREDRDIHRETAARIFGVSFEAVSGEMRARAKTINFATIYGQGPVALAAQLGISRAEASTFISQYFERFRGVAEYLEKMRARAREHGYVETILGRRRYIPEIRSRNPGVRGFGERTAANSPIQGTAADLIKIAMIRLHRRLQGTGVEMLLQVHDELLFEVPEEARERILQIVREEMEGAFELKVPLKVDCSFGENWYACKAE